MSDKLNTEQREIFNKYIDGENIFITGPGGVGKTHLQSKVAELIPEEDKIEITVLSANAFYYFNRT